MGYPKYLKNDEVVFIFNGSEKIGVIAMVDSQGTFGQNDEVSYDIFSEEGCLFKHITESRVLRRLDEDAV